MKKPRWEPKPYPRSFYKGAGVIDGRLWWEQTTVFWELPFYSDIGFNQLPDRDDSLAAREQLWAMRELARENNFAAI